MLHYIIKRFLFLFVVMFGVSIFTFLLFSLAPGDPAEIILRFSGMPPSPEAVEEFRQELGLDRPLWQRYIYWVWDIMNLDFGRSYVSRRPVAEEILSRIPATAELALVGMFFMLIISIPCGIISSFFQKRSIDHVTRILALLGAATPRFWMGLLLIYYIGMRMDWFPMMGRGTWRHLLLPGFTLAFSSAATYTRLLRANILEILAKDFILVAKAKGLSERAVMVKHALKNAMLPVITAFGIDLGYLLGGTVIVEIVFAWPGIGRYVINSIHHRDYPVIQTYVLFLGFVFTFINLMVDLSYRALDPRIKLGSK